MAIDKILLHLTKELLQKKGFIPPPDYQQQAMGMGPGAPMGAAGMQGGMPPGIPMDPSMMGMPPGGAGGSLPPEAMMGAGGGLPPEAMMGGGMPPPPAEAPPEEEGAKQFENMENRLKNLEDKSKLIIDKLDLLMQEVDYTKAGSDKNVPLLYAMKQLVTEK